MIRLYLLLPFFLFAETTVFEKASIYTDKYQSFFQKKGEIATPKTEEALENSTFLTIDLAKVDAKAMQERAFLTLLLDTGFDGIALESLYPLNSMEVVDSSLLKEIKKSRFALMGKARGALTDDGGDFALALRNYEIYPSLFTMIPIEKKYWHLLPSPLMQKVFANITYLELKPLTKLKLIPSFDNPYIKRSFWQASGKVQGIDGRALRWIYLTTEKGKPNLAYDSSTFAAERLEMGALLHATFTNGIDYLLFEPMPENVSGRFAKMFRKTEAYSIANSASSDLVENTFLQKAALHALITEDSSFLTSLYLLYYKQKKDLKRFCYQQHNPKLDLDDFATVVMEKGNKVRYKDEWITGELLNQKLLTEDVFALQGKTVTDCQKSLQKPEDIKTAWEKVIAFTLCMQPGLFSIHLDDLLGLDFFPLKKVDPMEPIKEAKKVSLPVQLVSPHSTINYLKDLFEVKKRGSLTKSDLFYVGEASSKGVLLLVFETPSKHLILSAINFSSLSSKESLSLPRFKYCNAIDLTASLSAEKEIASETFTFSIPALSGKIFYFHPSGA